MLVRSASQPAHLTLALGVRLGAYEIVSLLGAGRMGEVYRWCDPRLGREVEIKVLPERVAIDPGGLTLFEREAHAVAALSHPNILSLHDSGQSETIVSAAKVELLHCTTLGERLKEGPSYRKAVEYAIQVANALSAPHARGIVDRDLKPENISVTTVGRVKLLDLRLHDRSRTSSHQRRLTCESDEAGPFWSPGGSSIAYGSRAGDGRFALFLEPSSGARKQEENPTPSTPVLNWTTVLK